MTTALDTHDCIKALADTPFPLYTDEEDGLLFTIIGAGLYSTQILFYLRSVEVDETSTTLLDLVIPFRQSDNETLLHFPGRDAADLFRLHAMCQNYCTLAEVCLKEVSVDKTLHTGISLDRTELLSWNDLHSGPENRLVQVLAMLQEDWERLNPILQGVARSTDPLDVRIFELVNCSQTVH